MIIDKIVVKSMFTLFLNGKVGQYLLGNRES